MAEAAPAAPYDERLTRALDALVYAPLGGAAADAAAATAAADEVLRADDADATQARCSAHTLRRMAQAACTLRLAYASAALA